MDIADFLPEVALEAVECPEAVMLNALRNAIRDFCLRSGIWAEDLADIALLTDQPEYSLTLPDGAEFVRIEKARYNGRPVGVFTEQEMDDSVSNWRASTGASLSAIVSLSQTTIRAYPVPEADDTNPLMIRAVLKPTLAAATCHDDVGSWSEGIVAGALFRLKKMPNKPWSDREGAAVYRNEFEAAVGRATDSALRGHARRSLSVQHRSFV